jgi:hypothetical protein
MAKCKQQLKPSECRLLGMADSELQERGPGAVASAICLDFHSRHIARDPRGCGGTSLDGSPPIVSNATALPKAVGQ